MRVSTAKIDPTVYYVYTPPLLLCLSERGRSRRKKRDFFGTIKRRLNRSKVRSKSVDPGDHDLRDQSPSALSRSISADRAHDGSQHSSGML